MDLFTLQRRNRDFAAKMAVPATVGGDSDDAKAAQIADIVKRVTSKTEFKNRWGGKDYPVDVSQYGQFLSTLQSLSWVLRDIGYETVWLTRGGLSYSNTDYYLHPGLFDGTTQKIVALVAVGKDDSHYRFSRDAKTLRIRKFTSMNRAISPMRDGDTSGTKPIAAGVAKEIVRVMRTQSLLNPNDESSLRRWGRVLQNKSLKPIGAASLKTQLKAEFRKV